jgi:1-deoxy-D-xylulose-5-phosphate synthase
MTSHAQKFPLILTNQEEDTNSVKKPILPTLESPADIRQLEIPALKQLAREVRQRIIRVIAKKGGHFGAPLGAVELAVACLKVLDVPTDKVVWDVGHQAYAWKILTGRNAQFETIRQHKGLSGFLKRSESDCDAFGAGHASTSISAALGMAMARDLKGQNNKVVSIIGDGSMTGGMAYEALNNAGLRRVPMVVILNDNEMSISENVWAVHKGLSNLITHPAYNRAKQDIKKIVRMLMGESAVNAAHSVEEAVKGMMVPGLFFEELGIRYVGPVDGHNLETLVPILSKIVEFDHPILLHVITKKGKGLSYAEADPIKYHAAKANMKIETGEMALSHSPISYTKVFGQTLVELGRENKNVAAITAAMPGGTGTDLFGAEFPNRFYDVGIAEECAVTVAAGMATEKIVPVCAIYSTFLQRGFDQIIHDVALQKLPVRFVLDRAGLVGADGPTHHGVFDLSYLRMIPGMVIMAPRNEQELRRMLRTQIEYNDGPSAMRYPRGNSTGTINLEETPYPALEIGKGEVLAQGERVALLAIGIMVQHFQEAAPLIEERLGTPVTVVDARFVKPLDRELILELAQTHDYLFTAEDNALPGGFGSSVNEMLIAEKAPIQATPFGIPDQFVDHGQPRELYQDLGLMPDQLADKICRILDSKS